MSCSGRCVTRRRGSSSDKCTKCEGAEVYCSGIRRSHREAQHAMPGRRCHHGQARPGNRLGGTGSRSRSRLSSSFAENVRASGAAEGAGDGAARSVGRAAQAGAAASNAAAITTSTAWPRACGWFIAVIVRVGGLYQLDTYPRTRRFRRSATFVATAHDEAASPGRRLPTGGERPASQPACCALGSVDRAGGRRAAALSRRQSV
jgi:hypothetical protein